MPEGSVASVPAARPGRPVARGRVAFGTDLSPTWRFLLWAVATAVGAALVYGVLVLTEAGQRAENAALLGAALHGASDREASLGHLTNLSQLSFAFAIVAVFGVAFAQRRAGLGLVVAAVMGMSAVLAEALQVIVPRPELVTGPIWILRNSFPSGHAAVASAIGVGAVLVSPDRLRWAVVPAAAVYAALVGQATQIAGWHRLSGAIGGCLLVMVVAGIALAFLARAGYVRESDRGGMHRGIRGTLVAIAAGAIVLAALIIALPVAFPLLSAPRNAEQVFFHTAFDLFGAGITILLFVALAKLIAPFSLGRARSDRQPPRSPVGLPGRA